MQFVPSSSCSRLNLPGRAVLARLLLLSCLAGAAPFARATDLQVGTPSVSEQRVEFALSWRNAWRNSRNHDAVWLTLRPAAEPHRGILPLAAEGHSARGRFPAQISVSEDRLGVFLAPAADLRDDVEWVVSLRLARPSGEALEVWAVEMVHVPAGGFELGDTHPDLVADSAFYRVDSAGGLAGPFPVESESAIEVGEEPGQLYYQPGPEPLYRGDRKGPIPEAFPKGTRAFYVMKYELRQGEYARFLNALPEPWLLFRANHEVTAEESATLTIRRRSGVFEAGSASRPCNFLSWADSAAFADWMGLRPMTEFEFEKAARGPRRPLPADYPWGVSSRDRLQRMVTPERDLRHADSGSEASLSEATREEHGASYYWVFDLSGSLWERIVSAGHPRGRAFQGSHGDGRLGERGEATNADWPTLAEDGRAAPGIGYRGGAEYFSPPSLTNPFSPVASRTFAAWDGAFRSKTYSARAVRTAPR